MSRKIISTDTDVPTTTTVVEISPSPTNSKPPSSSKHVNIGAIIGGIVAGIVIATIAVAMIVPCARRRQRRIRDPGDGRGGKVLRKAADAEASEPMMNGSWRDHSRISEEDRMRSLGSSSTPVIPPGESCTAFYAEIEGNKEHFLILRLHRIFASPCLPVSATRL